MLEVFAAYEDAYRRDPEGTGQAADIPFHAAQAYQHLGQPRRALELLDQAIAQSPQVAGYYGNRALAQHALGRSSQSLADDAPGDAAGADRTAVSLQPWCDPIGHGRRGRRAAGLQGGPGAGQGRCRYLAQHRRGRGAAGPHPRGAGRLRPCVGEGAGQPEGADQPPVAAGPGRQGRRRGGGRAGRCACRPKTRRSCSSTRARRRPGQGSGRPLRTCSRRRYGWIPAWTPPGSTSVWRRPGWGSTSVRWTRSTTTSSAPRSRPSACSTAPTCCTNSAMTARPRRTCCEPPSWSRATSTSSSAWPPTTAAPARPTRRGATTPSW